MIYGILVVLGIFAGLVTSTVVPQSATSQLTPPKAINQSSSAAKPNASQNNGSQIIVLPGITGTNGSLGPIIIRDPERDDVFPKVLAPPVIINDPGGHDMVFKDCRYDDKRYSPGSQIEMPGASGSGTKVVKTCNGRIGEWV